MPAGKKLTIGFAILLALILGSGLGALRSIHGLGASLNSVVDVTAKKMDLADSLVSGFRQVRLASTLSEISLLDATLMGSMKLSEKDETTCGACHSLDSVANTQTAVDAAFANVGKTASALDSLLENPAERETLRRIRAGLPEWQNLHRQYMTLAREREFSRAHDIVLEHIYPLVADLEKRAEELHKAEAAGLAAARDDAKMQVRSSGWRSGGVIVISFGIGMLVLLAIRRVKTTLKASSASVAELTRHLAGATEQIASASGSLAQNASKQAESLEVTRVSSDEVRSSSHANAAEMGRASETTELMSTRVQGANTLLDETVTAMSRIDECAKKISGIAKLIDGIAFQTNLLALNAAVEAARAGHAGLGFGVVADEVRKLAQQCAQAAQDTTSLIAETLHASEDGKARLNSLATAIESITNLTGAIQQKFGAVNSASHAQERSLDAMGESLVHIESVTREVATCAEQNASASEELNAQASSLQRVVDDLNQLVG